MIRGIPWPRVDWPAPRHAIATSYLGGELTGPYGRGRGGPGGWLILDEPELHLGGHVLVPDLAGWLRERMPAPPETAWFAVRHGLAHALESYMIINITIVGYHYKER